VSERTVHEWSEDEAYQHCLDLWNRNFREFPDLLEPYLVSLDNAETRQDRVRVMRQGLAETFTRRFP
jgi:hypothetical protein